MKIAWIGTGIMGGLMVEHLAGLDEEVIVYNRTQSKLKGLADRGLRTTNELKEAVMNADLVFSMLATPSSVTDVFFGNDGALSAMPAGALWVDCSTVDPKQSILSLQEAQKFKVDFLEAPVAGTKPHAAGAELVFFVGGKEVDIVRVQPYLDRMGKKTLHVGEVSKAAALKLLVNMMLAQSMLAFSEAVVVGQALGLDETFLLDFLPNTAVAAPFTKMKSAMMRLDEYEVQFPLEWMYKDLKLLSDSVKPLGQPLYLTGQTAKLYAAAMEGGMSRLDFAAIHRHLMNSSVSSD